MAEELLNVLAKVPGLRVASRTSAFAFRDCSADLATVARALDVATVLEGSVRRAGERVRITAQLIETATDSHLWSQTYDRMFDDMLAVGAAAPSSRPAVGRPVAARGTRGLTTFRQSGAFRPPIHKDPPAAGVLAYNAPPLLLSHP